ncbi:hypothetical protein MmiEs2_13470 [Methanimicrococcus stummii]|uniref:Serine dehydrogenase proteinase n=1 Tax=Methanimicrococcus stummii TaxID=3028294 RepID=A0AA96VBA0_9EURY|nr:hypothetical protein [Methanimicrococcus sp. Es2]WNY29130.1 hypothetical protein MmiEs2_13470 [Methanimicrococcus sp. Es2]
MSYSDRINLYNKIEKHRKRPLIVYATSIRSGMSSSMAGDVVTEFIKHVRLIPESEKKTDLLIISNGGDPIASWRIMNILRERFEEISVLVPFVAYSAATLLALGADEIIMHPYSNLGPVDPQIIVQKQTPTGPNRLHFGSEDIRNYIDFIRDDFGITDQQYIVQALEQLSEEVGVLPIGSAKRSNQLSISLCEKMLMMHMKDQSKTQSIAKTLNSSYFHHGYAVGRKEAKEIGLNIASPDSELESLIWEVWNDISNEMKCEKNFNFISEILELDEFDFLLSAPQNETIQINSNSVDIKVLGAILETKCACSCREEVFKIFAFRNPTDLNIRLNVTPSYIGWKFQ